jgi:isoleucyl-tRNA synthetase
MMRYDECDNPEEKRPFKNLLGHRLVMDERGNAMHKSDGTAIWFEEAAEQLGVDTLRWLYLAQNPAQDLRFGTRHPDEPVALHTPEGTISETKEGLPTCKVTSSPADEVRRQILIPLWNSYAFFVNYARLDEFDPTSELIPVEQRPEIDRWILSNLQALIQKCRDGFEAYDTPRACAAAAEFIDDLSNWYIRRNRRRFWRSRKETQADDLSSSWDPDKLAAYQTLHEVLVTLTKVLAPVIPFLAEHMYQNLAVNSRSDHSPLTTHHSPVPQSVHLCDYPDSDAGLLDPGLNSRMAIAQLVVTLGHKLREESNIRVRQPLGELRYACGLAEQKKAVESLSEVIRDELNVKQLTPVDNLDELVSYSFKPNLKTLGPKYGKLLGALRVQIETADPEALAPLRRGESMTFQIDGLDVALSPEDVLVSTEQAADWVVADDRGIQIALSTKLTPELLAEGIRNDFIRHVQQARKEANLEIQDRIRVFYHTDDAACGLAVERWADYIQAETLADKVTFLTDPPTDAKAVTVGDAKATIWIAPV